MTERKVRPEQRELTWRWRAFKSFLDGINPKESLKYFSADPHTGVPILDNPDWKLKLMENHSAENGPLLLVEGPGPSNIFFGYNGEQQLGDLKVERRLPGGEGGSAGRQEIHTWQFPHGAADEAAYKYERLDSSKLRIEANYVLRMAAKIKIWVGTREYVYVFGSKGLAPLSSAQDLIDTHSGTVLPTYNRRALPDLVAHKDGETTIYEQRIPMAFTTQEVYDDIVRISGLEELLASRER